jgi:serine/threonine protein kinase
MSIYIPTPTYKRSDCEALFTTYESKGFVDQGAYGQVYQACKRGTSDCDYVVKVIKYNHGSYVESGGMTPSLQKKFGEWEKEVDVMTALNETQRSLRITLCPILYDAWYCRKGEDVEFYILMEKFDGDLRSFIKKYKKSSMINLVSVELLLDGLYKSLLLIHDKHGICLDDVKLANILYRINDEGRHSFVFADFGKAKFSSTEECMKQDRESFSRHIEAFFEDLRKKWSEDGTH